MKNPVVVKLLLALLLSGCGERKCEKGECQVVRDADGKVVETICPDDCKP